MVPYYSSYFFVTHCAGKMLKGSLCLIILLVLKRGAFAVSQVVDVTLSFRKFARQLLLLPIHTY